MNTVSRHSDRAVIPNRRKRHYSYNEGVNESSKLIEDEPVEIEAETPAEEARPVEGAEDNEKEDPPRFEG